MTFAVQVQGLDELNKRLDALNNPSKIKQAVLAGALLIESSAKESIAHGMHTGHVYTHGNVSHQASAPGQTPATDTGALISSIQHWVSEDGLSIAVGSRLEYATYLEFGTRKMGERPFIHPALDLNRVAIIANIEKAAQGTV